MERHKNRFEHRPGIRRIGPRYDLRTGGPLPNPITLGWLHLRGCNLGGKRLVDGAGPGDGSNWMNAPETSSLSPTDCSWFTDRARCVPSLLPRTHFFLSRCFFSIFPIQVPKRRENDSRNSSTPFDAGGWGRTRSPLRFGASKQLNSLFPKNNPPSRKRMLQGRPGAATSGGRPRRPRPTPPRVPANRANRRRDPTQSALASSR